MIAIISFYLMLAIFLSYISYIWSKYGILDSISDSYYILPANINFLFTLFCWGFATPAIICGNTALMFLAGSCICFIGVAAAFKEDLIRTIHLVGAYSGIIFSQLSIFFDFRLLYLNIIFIAVSLLIFLFKKYISHHIWWIEILAFSSICYAIGINILK